MKNSMRGFGMTEVLVSIVVMATGLLAVANLQTSLISDSGTSKARGEALALAQSRIEEFRNYTNDITTTDEFETAYVYDIVDNKE